MASKKNHINREKPKKKKKTRNGLSPFTKYGRPGPYGGNKNYKKRYRGQGK